MLCASAWLVFHAVSIKIKGEELNLNHEPGHPPPSTWGTENPPGAAPLLQGDLSCSSQLCDGISHPRTAQLTFLMPSRSLFVHLLPKAVEKREKCLRGWKVMPCSCPCSGALLCASARWWGRRGGCARHWDKPSCQFWGNPDPQMCLMEGGGCSALQQLCPCRWHVPPRGVWSPPPSLWSISMWHWGARCGCPSFQGVHVEGSCSSKGAWGGAAFPSLAPGFPLPHSCGAAVLPAEAIVLESPGRGPKCLEEIKN